MLNPGGNSVGRLATKRADVGHTGELMAKNPFYSLLGDCYAIVVREHVFVRVFTIGRTLGKVRVVPGLV